MNKKSNINRKKLVSIYTIVAIIYETDSAWFVDHVAAINQSVEDVGLRCPGDAFLFAKHGKFTAGKCDVDEIHKTKEENTITNSSQDVELTSRDSSTREGDAEDNVERKCNEKPKKRKRKRKQPLNVGELKMLQYHQKHSPFITKAKDEIVLTDAIKEHLSKLQGTLNLAGQQSINSTESFDELVEGCNEEGCRKLKDCHILNDSNNILTSIFDRKIINSRNKSTIMKYNNKDYVIPKKSSFVVSEFRNWVLQCDSLGEKYDLIVMDPPWENKSAKRKKSYNYLPEYDLKKLPIDKILHNGGLVVVWVTNKQKYLEFVLDVLFPFWGVELFGHWHWVKIGVDGAYITDIYSTQRKPYEPVLIGRKLPQFSPFEKVPENRIICSVPLNQHSRKPPLNQILEPFLPRNPRCLEMFARSLTPEWDSWGNETIKFQNLSYYVKKEVS